MWKFQHADGRREIDELHVPVGHRSLTMVSQDVIHSFYVPAFRVKKDVLPAVHHSWFQATKPGSVPPVLRRVLRHQPLGHGRHRHDPAQTPIWLSGGGGEDSLAAGGQKLFRYWPCHLPGGDKGPAGPPRRALRLKPVPLQTGITVLADDATSANPSSTRRQGRRRLPADHAHLPGPGQRERDAATAGLHQVAARLQRARPPPRRRSRFSHMGAAADKKRNARRYRRNPYTISTPSTASARGCSRRTTSASPCSISFRHGVLLHRRHLCRLIRIRTAHPCGLSGHPETYNKIFTMHGIIMIFFFLIPSDSRRYSAISWCP